MTTAADILGRARADVGLGADPNRITRQYGPGGWGISRLEGGYDWCAVSCYVWAREAGGSGLVSVSPFVREHVNFHQARGSWLGRTSAPRPGDEIVFSWGANASVDHIGLVESVSAGIVYTIEGNSGDAVRRRQYAISSPYIYGFGRPAYDGSSSAGGGGTPISTLSRSKRMEFVHVIDGGGALWTVVNTATGVGYQTRSEKNAQLWVTPLGAPKYLTMEEYLTWIALIKITLGDLELKLIFSN